MLKKLLISVVVLVIGFAGYVATLPDDFRYSRSLAIKASPEVIFEKINNPKKMAEWSPWKELDPNGTFSYEGEESGIGAISKWSGNADLGEGIYTIIDSIPYRTVIIKLDFIRPMTASNQAEFSLTPEGEQTLVTWSMYGKNNFIGKAMGLIFNCEKMLGDMFDKGLNNLKTISENTNNNNP